jgi:hypothetical protein
VNATNLTLLVVAIIGVISSYVTPKLLNRQQARRDAEAATDVSWVNINKAVVADRDRLQKLLDDSEADHAQEMKTLREQHRQEITELRNAHDQEIKALSERLAECQGRVGSLYDELRRRPPGT